MGAELSSYLLELLARGEVVFSSQEAEQSLGLGHGAFLDAAERLQKQKKLVRLRRGNYVVVPPQFGPWGAPPPSWYIDALMRHESSPYYVGLLKAAEIHGATHQAVLEFQIVAEKRMPNMQVGRSMLSFSYRKQIAPVSQAIADHKTDTGSMKVSSVELTALDLLRYPHASAGLDNVFTVLADLGEKIDSEKLAALSRAFSRSVVQRLGYLLDRLGYADATPPMLRELLRDQLPPWVELDPEEVAEPELAPKCIERDKRWNVVVRRKPEVDE
jgi:predicted transcriptional regulator of viral defense system